MIRLLFVDDHAATQAALETVMGADPGQLAVGRVASEGELWPVLYRMRPDVILLHHDVAGRDGLTLCHRLKATTLPPPRVIILSSAGADLAVAAVVAGADAIVDNDGPARDMLETILSVVGGAKVLPAISPQQLAAAANRLDRTDRSILAMRVDDTPLHEIGHTLRIEPGELLRRVDGIISRLRVASPRNAA